MGMVDPPSWKDTIAAVATGGVLSAIGIVRLSGPDTEGILDRVFRPADGRPMSAHGDRQLVYGRLLDPEGALLDLCLCTLSRGPRSYTGEDTGGAALPRLAGGAGPGAGEPVCRRGAAGRAGGVYPPGISQRAAGPDPGGGGGRSAVRPDAPGSPECRGPAGGGGIPAG